MTINDWKTFVYWIARWWVLGFAVVLIVDASPLGRDITPRLDAQGQHVGCRK